MYEDYAMRCETLSWIERSLAKAKNQAYLCVLPTFVKAWNRTNGNSF